ncbi:MAG: Ig-like domain-containing protein [Clostridia bacterium]|nr:Ig-like domain-containing protein [Clostridia bacterium]
MLLPYSGGAFVRLISTIILAFSVAVNGIGNLLGADNIIDTAPQSLYSVTANEAASSEITLEDENILYIRSTFREISNRFYSVFGIKSRLSATEIKIDRKKLSIVAGNRALLDADIIPSGARNKNVVFKSDNPKIATVSPYGLISALKPGNATIYAIAQDGGFYEKCLVTVTPGSVYCDSISLSAPSLLLEKDMSGTIEYSVFPTNTTDITSLIVSDLGIVSASLSNGVLTVTGKKAGTAVVAIRCGDIYEPVYVCVTNPSDESFDPSATLNTASVFGGNSSSGMGTIFRCVDSFPDGSYIACGTTASSDGSFDYLCNSSLNLKIPYSYVAKFTKYGTVEWIRLFSDTSASVLLYGVSVLNDGSIAAVGTYERPATDSQLGEIDAVIIRLSPNGAELYKNILEGSGDDFLYCVTATPSGYAVGGKTTSTNGDFDGIPKMSSIVISFDLNNAVLWKDYLNGSTGSSIDGIDADSDGNIFISCITTATDGRFASFNGLIGSYADTVVIKYNHVGEYQWHHVLATSGTDIFKAITADGNGGCVVAGNYTLNSSVGPDGTLEGIHNCGETDALAIRLDQNGERQWYKIISGFYSDYITDVVYTGSGFALTGYTSSSNREFASIGNKGGTDGFICYLDANGNIVKVLSHAGSGDDAALCLTYSDSNKELLVAGRTDSSDGSFADNAYSDSIAGYVGRYKKY